ncbi:hypothetical protein CANCADRAFT_3693 [Tortispora caseinolytica NRRL Y-17796]|uniref:Ran GTPase-activating protein 1 n=1 Tax=Tortispora caseinolytica NRRL Y-17796 TaxID=767744 RepID=A0A1E4TBG8_9ASCO|nr:hypothetical protein CANCADRAFT_3693 [Tortispora caseinolytica NRRL Y-17796]
MVKEYTLAGKALKLDTAEDVAPYIEELKSAGDVEKVDLRGNTLGVEAAKVLADEIGNLKSLNYANLADLFTGRLKEEIPQALEYLFAGLRKTNVSTVDLSDNALGMAAIDQLEPFLASHIPLEHLILGNNGLGPEAGSRVGNALAELAEKKQKVGARPLLTIVCARNRLENGSMKAWARAVSANSSLQRIEMYQNGIRPEGIELLLNAMNNHKEILHLDLQDNTFTSKGAAALAEILPGLSNIAHLTVSDCLLSAEGGLKISQVLASNELPKLETLKLQYNEIDKTGLTTLFNAVKSSLPNLKFLELNGNKFPEDHSILNELRALLEERGGELDELDDLEEDSEEEDESEEEEEEEELEEEIIRECSEIEDSNVAEDADEEVDRLAEALSKTKIPE